MRIPRRKNRLVPQLVKPRMNDFANIYLNTLVPMVVELTNRGERAYDIYSRLLKERASQGAGDAQHR